MTSQASLIDMSAFDQFVAMWGDEAGDVIQEIVGIFLENAPQLLGGMQGALEAGNMRDLQRLAHTIKSNSATVGAHSLAQVAQELEDAAKEGRREDAAVLFREIQDTFPEVRQQLEHILETFGVSGSA